MEFGVTSSTSSSHIKRQSIKRVVTLNENTIKPDIGEHD